MQVRGTDEWIPFEWDDKTGMWWICIYKDQMAPYGSRNEEQPMDIILDSIQPIE
jgi:hypothetical protein